MDACQDSSGCTDATLPRCDTDATPNVCAGMYLALIFCYNPDPSQEFLIFQTSQRAETVLDKISNNINKTYTGLISVLQGFQKCVT